MSEEISNGMLLEHMQAMKTDLQRQIAGLDKKIDTKITVLEKYVRKGFEEARQHRQALQEDLDASIRMLGKHDAKLAHL